MKSNRPITALDNNAKLILPPVNNSTAQNFNNQSQKSIKSFSKKSIQSSQNLEKSEEFLKLTSKPFSNRTKPKVPEQSTQLISQTFDMGISDLKSSDLKYQVEPSEEDLSDIISVRQRLDQLSCNRELKIQELNYFIDEMKNQKELNGNNRYDFPTNYQEIVDNSVSQIRFRNNNIDVLSVYSSIDNIQMEFNQQSKNEKQKLQINLYKIKELEQILKNKEKQLQDLVNTRLSNSDIQSESSQDNVFLTNFKKQERTTKIKKIMPKFEETVETQPEKQKDTHFIDQNKIIQKKEDKYKLTEEQQQRVETILKTNITNIYTQLQIEVKEDQKLIDIQKQLVQLIQPVKEEKQPKDVFILKQKEEISIQKEIKSINKQLMNMVELEKIPVSNEEINDAIIQIKQQCYEQPDIQLYVEEFQKDIDQVQLKDNQIISLIQEIQNWKQLKQFEVDEQEIQKNIKFALEYVDPEEINNDKSTNDKLQKVYIDYKNQLQQLSNDLQSDILKADQIENIIQQQIINIDQEDVFQKIDNITFDQININNLEIIDIDQQITQKLLQDEQYQNYLLQEKIIDQQLITELQEIENLEIQIQLFKQNDQIMQKEEVQQENTHDDVFQDKSIYQNDEIIQNNEQNDNNEDIIQVNDDLLDSLE